MIAAHLTPWLIGGFMALVVGSALVAIRSQRAKQQALREALRSLGFIPAEPTPELVRRLTYLHAGATAGDKQSSKQKYEVKNVFSRRFGDGEMFVFDLEEKDSDSGHTERQGIAVVSERLKLPRFTLVPRTGGEGTLSKLADRAIAWASRKVGAQVEFPNHPELSRHYLVHSPDADATRRFLESGRLNRLAETRHVFIRAADDVFTVSSVVSTTAPVGAEQLRERVDRAAKVFSILSA